jgi:hypothetical protein
MAITGMSWGNSMKIRSEMKALWAVVAVCLVLTVPASARVDAPAQESPDKVAVVDGRYVHDVGELWHHVSNWGLLGSAFSLPTTFSDSPSAMWPAGSGDEYLWAAGLWVGGNVLGEHLVSTAGLGTEFLPTEAELDTIYPTYHGAPGGARYPWDFADDDGDGLEDEEILNGLDDDGDGLIDEDFAAYSDQHFVCGYTDYEPGIMENNPDHTPLNIKVIQQSAQWSDPVADDFVGYDFTITNMGVVPIQDVYLGMFSDNDIGPRGVGDVASDDHAGFYTGMVLSSSGTWVHVQVSYMYDGAQSQHIDGYAGWVLCGHPTDPDGAHAPAEVGVRSFHRFSGMLPFGQGGDPTNDWERYQLLSGDEIDSNTLPGMENDYRTLISSGPFTTLEPGESIGYQVALVLGASLEDMLVNAAEAVLTYQGVAYDRDGDPGNGAEYQVHWLRPDDAPVAAGWGQMDGQLVTGGVALTLETNLEQGDGWSVIRQAGASVSERVWSSEGLEPAGFVGGKQSYRLVDRDPVGWPRTYKLVRSDGQFMLTLDQVDLAGPENISLTASPNPFNPRVNFSLAVAPGDEARVEVFDLRGLRVARLWDGPVPDGAMDLTWQGKDASGRSLASGVYEVRLITDTRVLSKRITLLR